LILDGCATEPDEGPTSAADFELFDCPQLKEHAQHVSKAALEVAGLVTASAQAILLQRTAGSSFFFGLRPSWRPAKAHKLMRFRG
jgi:hypothetical protein